MYQFASVPEHSSHPRVTTAVPDPLACVGKVEIENRHEPSLRGVQANLCSTAIWRPTGDVQHGLDPGFAIRHEIEVLPNGFRAITPADHLRAYSAQAWAAGRQLLNQQRSLSENQTYDTFALHLMFDRVRKSHGIITRHFAGPKDLQVSYANKSELDSILPAGLGHGPQEFDLTWSLAELLEHGKERSERDGFSGCSFETTVAFGLMVAAERYPLLLSPSELSKVLQNTLFAAPESTRPAEFGSEISDLVWCRLVTALRHHEDDTLEEFAAWFRGGSSNLIKLLAGRPKAAGGQLSRELVQWALYDFTWLAVQQAARCQDAYAEAFTAAISPAFQPCEKNYFYQIHGSQAYLGGLTLALIWDRRSQLMPILTRIWTTPNDAVLWPVLWRMMHYYSLMVFNRREADRATKFRGKLVPYANVEDAIRPKFRRR